MSKLAFDDSEEEDTTPVAQPLTEISFNAVESVSATVVPLIIERIPNSFRGSKNYVPDALTQSRTSNGGRSIAELEAAEKARNNVYGLNKPTPSHGVPLAALGGTKHISETLTIAPEKQLTDEQAAIQALLSSEESTKDQTIARLGGNELFSKVEVHPEMSSLEEYEAVPVESFGLAMLRGMGYDPKQDENKDKMKEKLRRPDFLGLGASERPEDSKSAQELAKKKFEKRKEDRTYVPVVKVNKRTGEVVVIAEHDGDAMASLKPSGTSSSVRSNGVTKDRNDGHSEDRDKHYSRSRYDDSSRSRHTSHERNRRRSDRDGIRESRRSRSRSPRRDSSRDRHSFRRQERRRR